MQIAEGYEIIARLPLMTMPTDAALLVRLRDDVETRLRLELYRNGRRAPWRALLESGAAS